MMVMKVKPKIRLRASNIGEEGDMLLSNKTQILQEVLGRRDDKPDASHSE